MMGTTKIAIIGTGLIGSLHARICSQMPEVVLVAIHDIQKDRVEALAAELRTRAYSGSDHRQIFRENPEIEAVLICTPQEHHLVPALAAVEAGIQYLLVEKPLAANVTDAQKMLHAATERAKFAMISYSLRFDPRYVNMKRAVERGEIGEITHIYAQRNPPAAAMERLQGVELPFWVGVHDIDMLRWITSSEVVRVYATGIRRGFEDSGVWGSILSNFTFENGVIAVLENAWRPTSPTGRTLSLASFSVNGTRGYIEVKSSDQGIKIIRDGETYIPDSVNMPEVSGEIVGVYRNQVNHFVRCIREGLPSPIPLQEGLQGVKVAEAILKSISERREVIISEEYPV